MHISDIHGVDLPLGSAMVTLLVALIFAIACVDVGGRWICGNEILKFLYYSMLYMNVTILCI